MNEFVTSNPNFHIKIFEVFESKSDTEKFRRLVKIRLLNIYELLGIIFTVVQVQPLQPTLNTIRWSMHLLDVKRKSVHFEAMCVIVWIDSSQSHPGLPTNLHFSIRWAHLPCSVLKQFKVAHSFLGKETPGTRIVRSMICVFERSFSRHQSLSST